jgi:hypothetical protein
VDKLRHALKKRPASLSGTAVGNIMLNPAFAWLGNRELAFTPLTGGGSIIVDTAITKVKMSLATDASSDIGLSISGRPQQVHRFS